jgi:hypothetical protein
MYYALVGIGVLLFCIGKIRKDRAWERNRLRAIQQHNK